MFNVFTQFKGLKKEIYLLFFGRLVTAMGSFVWPMLTLFLTVKLGYTDSYAAGIIALASFLSFPASVIGGKLTDKFGRKNIIVYFDIVTVSLYILASFLPYSFYTVLIIFFAGLFQTAESPAYDALISDFSTTEKRDKAYSLSYLGFNLGFILGASISGFLFKDYFNLALLINGLAILSSTIIIIFFIHERNSIAALSEDVELVIDNEYEKPLDQNLGVFKALKGRGVLFYTVLASGLGSIVYGIVGLLLPLQLKAMLGEDSASIYGLLNSLNGLTVIIFTPLMAYLLKRIRDLTKMTLALALFIISMILFGYVSLIPVFFVAEFIYTLGEVSSAVSRSPYFSKRIPRSHLGRVYGIMGAFMTILSSSSMLFSSFLLSKLGQQYDLIWLVYIIVGLMSMVIYAISFKLDKKTFPLLYNHSTSNTNDSNGRNE